MTTLMDFDEQHAAALAAIDKRISDVGPDGPDLPNLQQRRDAIAAHGLGVSRSVSRAGAGGYAQVCSDCGQWWPCDPFLDATRGLGVLDDTEDPT